MGHTFIRLSIWVFTLSMTATLALLSLRSSSFCRRDSFWIRSSLLYCQSLGVSVVRVCVPLTLLKFKREPVQHERMFVVQNLLCAHLLWSPFHVFFWPVEWDILVGRSRPLRSGSVMYTKSRARLTQTADTFQSLAPNASFHREGSAGLSRFDPSHGVHLRLSACGCEPQNWLID